MPGDRLAGVLRAWEQGEYVRVIQQATEILREPVGLTAEQGVSVAKLGAGAAMSLSYYREAIWFAEQEQEWAEALGSKVAIATALYHRGTVAIHVGDTHQAILFLRQYMALDDGDTADLAPYRGAARFNLGTALMQRQEFGEATAMLRSAREAFIVEGNQRGIIRCYLQMAWNELVQGHSESAGAYTAQAARMLELYPDPELLTSTLCRRAYYHWQVGELAEATRLCEEILAEGRPGSTAHYRAEGAWIAGECGLALGQLEAARKMAECARDQATEDRWIPGINRATDLLRRIREAEERSA